MNLDKKVKLEYVRQYGDHCMAYSTLAEGLSDFVVPGIEGYLSYMRDKNVTFLVSDPICPKDSIPKILGEFTDFCRNNKSRVIGLEMGQKSFEGLKQSGYIINDFGVEFDLNLKEFSLKGKKMGYIRRRYNMAKREGVVTVESRPSKEDISEIRAISDEWLKYKNHGIELLGLTRPLVLDDEPDVRYFFAKKDGKMLGFVIWDPLYENGKIKGYYHNFVRFKKKVPNGISVLATVDSLIQFKEEGFEMSSLGQSPLHNMENKHGLHSKPLQFILQMLYNYGTVFYPFKGNAFHKEKYRGHPHKVYMAVQRKLPLWEIYKAMKMMKIV